MASKAAAPDLSKLSFAELQALIAEAQSQVHERRSNELATLAESIQQTISQSGFSLDEVAGALGLSKQISRGPRAVATTRKSGGGGAVAPKYKHGPDSWTGRGKTPKWLSALLAQGHSKDEFLIKK